MLLHTKNKATYKVKWLEYWEEGERFILAETKDGDVIKIALEDFDRVEEGGH